MFKSNINQDERLKDLIAGMSLDNSYWGYLFGRIRRVPKRNFGSIMAVAALPTGVLELWYHPELCMTTTDKMIRLVIEHEGMHILNKHVSRLIRILVNESDDEKKAVKTELYYMAADCAVNTQMNMPEVLTIGNNLFPLLFPQKYNLPVKKSTEYYYLRLLQQQQQNEKDGKGKGLSAIPGAGDNPQSIDDHSKWNENLTSLDDQTTISRKVEGYIEEIVKDSLKSFAKRRDTIPGHIAELIDQALTPPKVPYYQLIRRLVKGSRLSKYKRAYTKVNKKRTYVFAMDNKCIPVISPFPGKMRDFSFKIVVLIDTSGSMDIDDIKEGLSGVKHIIENDKHTETIVLENDTRLQKEYRVKRIHDIDFKVAGRGGTTLRPGLTRTREINPDVCLVFTDGYCDDINTFPKRSLPKKLIWVIQKEGTADMVNRTGYVVRI